MSAGCYTLFVYDGGEGRVTGESGKLRRDVLRSRSALRRHKAGLASRLKEEERLERI